jgi:hypothetical protein
LHVVHPRRKPRAQNGPLAPRRTTIVSAPAATERVHR